MPEDCRKDTLLSQRRPLEANFLPGVLRGLLGSLMNKIFQIQAASFNGNAIQLSEAEYKYPRPPRASRTEQLWWTKMLQTRPSSMACAPSWAQGDTGHTGESPDQLSVKCSLLRKNLKKTPKDSRVHSD